MATERIESFEAEVDAALSSVIDLGTRADKLGKKSTCVEAAKIMRETNATWRFINARLLKITGFELTHLPSDRSALSLPDRLSGKIIDFHTRAKHILGQAQAVLDSQSNPMGSRSQEPLRSTIRTGLMSLLRAGLGQNPKRSRKI